MALLALLICWTGVTESQGTLQITRLELMFESEKRIEVFTQDDESVVLARIQYSGSGFLNGQWEVASPPSTSANPQFIAVGFVQELLSGSGDQQLASPALPVNSVGAYLVRLKLDQTDAYNNPRNALRYQVIPR
jgi:hypothetical protein